MSARGAIASLLEAAGRLSRDESLVLPIAASTGLSPEGVRLALQECLEHRAGGAEVDQLIASTPPASRVHVILSANVLTAPLRALAVARAAAPRVTVRPSRRDPIFTRALVAAAPTSGVELAEALQPGEVHEGEIHAYGRSETLAAVRDAVPPGVTLRLHGPGLGIAWVGAEDDLEAAAACVANDVVPFDQRGCLSPRFAIVMGERRARAFAEALHAALADRQRAVPRGIVADDVRLLAARWIDAMRFAGEVFVGEAHAVGIGARGLEVPPAARYVQVLAASTPSSVAEMIAPLAGLVSALGASDESMASALGVPHARVSRLGAMQRPPLDGPVDRRPSSLPTLRLPR